MRRRRLALILPAAVLAVATFSGCITKPPAVTTKWDNRPTEPLDVVLQRINANSGRIATLNADGTFDAVLANGKDQATGQTRYESLAGGVKFMHTKPSQIVVEAQAAVAGTRAFSLGSNGSTYWFSAFGNIDTTWYGTPRGTALTDPRLPVAPELLVDVLGVATLNTDLLAQPIPTLRYNPDQAAYMLTWHQPISDRWVTLREIWYDRETYLPSLVILFDRNGRATLRAKLSNYKPIRLDAKQTDDAPTPPVMAHTIDMFFPETRSTMKFVLDDVRDKRGGTPRRGSYTFSPDRAGTSRVIDLDADAPNDRP